MAGLTGPLASRRRDWSVLRQGSHATPGSGRSVTTAVLPARQRGAAGKVRGLCKSCLCWAWKMTSGSATTGHPRESRELHCRMTRPLLGQLLVSIARGRTWRKLWQRLGTDFAATGVVFLGTRPRRIGRQPIATGNQEHVLEGPTQTLWDQPAWVVSKFATQHARRHGPACRGADADCGATEEGLNTPRWVRGH